MKFIRMMRMMCEEPGKIRLLMMMMMVEAVGSATIRTMRTQTGTVTTLRTRSGSVSFTCTASE